MTGAPFPRVIYTARRVYWEVSPGCYRATESADSPPKGSHGYADLAALCRLKGDAPPPPAPLAERLARRLFPDDVADGKDCRAEVGREGAPCGACAAANSQWADRVQAVRLALELEGIKAE